MTQIIFGQMGKLVIKGTAMMGTVLLLRPALKKLPRNLNCLLWAFLAIRLMIPWNFEIALPYLTIPDITADWETKAEQTAKLAKMGESMNGAGNILWKMAAFIWLTGAIVVFAYWIRQNIRLQKTVREAVLAEELSGQVKIFESDRIDTAFVLGVFRPAIYLPENLPGKDRSYVIMHEMAHVHRRDYLWKWFCCLLTALYWFHPLIWICAAAFSKDVEEACDEAVLKKLEKRKRLAYAEALFGVADKRERALRGGLGFGEGDVKMRIMHILEYKKRAAAGVAAAAVLILLGGGLFFMERGNTNDFSAIGTVSEDVVRVRKGPGVQHETVGLVSKGEQVQITGKVQDDTEILWYKVEFPMNLYDEEFSNGEFYIMAEFLTVE